MAYQQNIPLSTDLLSQSQADLLGNFQSLYNWVQTNHVTFDIGDAGKHKWISLPSQGAIPPAGSAFTATEVGLYNAVAGTGQQELFVYKQVAGAVTLQIPMTDSILSINATPGLGAQGWSYLPSGILMKWGQVAYAFGAPSTITFPVGATIPVFAQVMFASVTFAKAGAATANLQIWDYSNAQIRYTGANVTGSVNYLAIGY